VSPPTSDCSNHKVPAVTNGSSGSRSGDGDNDDDDESGPLNMSTAELIGVIAGGCVVVALIVGAIVLAVRRARKPSAVQYMPVHTEVDDDWSVN